ncbi:hypothetical protein ABI59_11430 [Acidobacteria bacterium Mor1]|nr:hypothetical protein ABI59_11430 [Acidobacteria bacterium Mor1]
MRRRLLIMLLVLLALPWAAADESAEPGVPFENWEVLRLKARKLMVLTGRVEMKLARGAERDVLETETVARAFGGSLADTRTRSVVEHGNGRSLEYTSRSKKRGRNYRFGPESFVVEKLWRDPDVKDASWEVTSSDTYPNPGAAVSSIMVGESAIESPPLYDYYAMILQLGRSELRKVGDEMVFQVATSKGPRAFRVTVGEERDNRRKLINLRTGRKEKLELRELRLRVTPADPEAADEGFMNMEGETELWIEAESGTLLQISGKVENVPGQVHIQLAEIG